MRRVLTVDDSRAVRDAVRAALEPSGIEVEDAENGATALVRLRADPFDLVFLDLHMPVLDGPSLLRMMRAQGVTAKVVLITTGASNTVVTSTIKLGAAEYISKPFTPDTVRAVTARVLGLDASLLQAGRARVLVQHPDDGLAQELHGLLPAHVEVEAVPIFADALERAAAGGYALVLFDAAVLEGAATAAAALLRERLPWAGIFAVAESASGPPWAPDGALDGRLPHALTEPLVRDFLLDVFLRPLAFGEGTVLRAAGRVAAGPARGAWLAALARALASRVTSELALLDISVDLTPVTLAPDEAAALIRAVGGHLEAQGAAPAFRVAPALRAALAARPDFQQMLFF